MRALRIVKAGLASSPAEVLSWPVDLYLDADEYARFISDYERASYELNQEQ